jgi:DNA-directed RNA polymerase subunit RPC12/RpoP
VSARQFLADTLKTHYQPRETRPIGEWARETITIEASENKAFSGQPFDISNTPYNATIFDFIQSEYWRELIVMKSSQVGLTYSVFIGMAWLAKHSPGNMMYVARDENTVRELGKQRITPILKQIGADVADDLSAKDQTIMVKRVNGATLRLVGAQSASGFITWPASYGFVDEAETHPLLNEGSTIDLTRARFKADPDYKLVVFSKAQDEPIYETDKTTKKQKITSGQGTRCADEYYSGTQEKLHVPCPRCQHRQELVWSQMRMEPECITSESGVLPITYDYGKVLTGTYYECQGCKGKIIDKDKRKIVPLGEWIPTPPTQRKGPYPVPFPHRRSIHISDLYVFLFSSVSWGNLMVKWLEAEGDDDKRDAFFNDHLGSPRPERKSSGKVELWAIDRLISNYPRLGLYDRGRRWTGEKIRLHNDPLFIGIAIDKQQDHLKFVISSFMENGEMFVLDYGALTDEDDLTFLLENFEAWGATDDEQPYRIMAGLMDCGHLRSTVINYAFRIRDLIRSFSPARGHGDVLGRRPLWVSKDISIPGEVVEIVNFDSQNWETELNRFRIMEARPDKPSRRHPRIFLPADVTDDFREELANAHQVDVPLRHGQGTRPMWQKAKPSQSNDFSDCMKMLLLIFAIHGPDPDDDTPPEAEGQD